MQYTDYFGQPINIGDEIIYPLHSGSSRQCYGRFPILNIIPLVPHIRSATHLMREDQLGRRCPTYYPMIEDTEKQYVVQVEKKSYRNHTTKFTVRWCENIVRVPDGY